MINGSFDFVMCWRKYCTLLTSWWFPVNFIINIRDGLYTDIRASLCIYLYGTEFGENNNLKKLFQNYLGEPQFRYALDPLE